MKKYEIGIYEKAIPEEHGMRTMLQVAKDAGYDFFEISIDRTDERIDRLYDRERIKDVIGMQQETGMRIDSMCLSALSTYTLGNADKIIRDKGVDIVLNAIRFSAETGIRLIQIPACDVPRGVRSTQDTLKYYIYSLHTAVEYASVNGVMIALENMESKQIDSVEGCMQFVREINSPYFQLYPDSGNIMTAAFNQGMAPEDDMACGKGHFASFHIKETTPARFGGLYYGDGHVDFPRLVKKAWEMGARRFVMEYWYTGNTEWKKDLDRACVMCKEWIESVKQI